MEEFLTSFSLFYTAESLEVRRYSFGKFVQFLQETTATKSLRDFKDLSLEDLESFKVWLSFQCLSSSTVHLVVRSVKLFLAWAHRTERSLLDVSSFDVPKAVSQSPKPPTIAVMQRLLSLPDESTPFGLRDRLVLELLYVLGLRRREASSLDLEHIDLDRETLLISGKGNEQRLLPLNPGLLRTLDAYLVNGRPKLERTGGEAALVLNQKGGRLSYACYPRHIKKYGCQLGVKLSCHQLRHACATHLLEQGMALEQVQVLLGHRDLSSTQYYAQISPSELRREYLRSHPRARMVGANG